MSEMPPSTPANNLSKPADLSRALSQPAAEVQIYDESGRAKTFEEHLQGLNTLKAESNSLEQKKQTVIVIETVRVGTLSGFHRPSNASSSGNAKAQMFELFENADINLTGDTRNDIRYLIERTFNNDPEVLREYEALIYLLIQNDCLDRNGNNIVNAITNDFNQIRSARRSRERFIERLNDRFERFGESLGESLGEVIFGAIFD